MNDGVAVRVEPDSGAGPARLSSTSATGFWGFVDLPPDRYRISFEAGETVLHRAVPMEVRPGEVTSADVTLRAEQTDPRWVPLNSTRAR